MSTMATYYIIDTLTPAENLQHFRAAVLHVMTIEDTPIQERMRAVDACLQNHTHGHLAHSILFM